MDQTQEARRGQFANLKYYYVKAATYDAAFARRADRYAGYDQAFEAAVTALTAFTTASVVTTIVDSGAAWAKIASVSLAGLAALLAAIRQGTNWGSRGETMRSQGAEWTKQRGKSRDILTHLLNGEKLDMAELDKLADTDRTLVASNPRLPEWLYQECKRQKKDEFEGEYSFTPLSFSQVAVPDSIVPVRVLEVVTTTDQSL